MGTRASPWPVDDRHGVYALPTGLTGDIGDVGPLLEVIRVDWDVYDGGSLSSTWRWLPSPWNWVGKFLASKLEMLGLTKGSMVDSKSNSGDGRCLLDSKLFYAMIRLYQIAIKVHAE